MSNTISVPVFDESKFKTPDPWMYWYDWWIVRDLDAARVSDPYIVRLLELQGWSDDKIVAALRDVPTDHGRHWPEDRIRSALVAAKWDPKRIEEAI